METICINPPFGHRTSHVYDVVLEAEPGDTIRESSHHGILRIVPRWESPQDEDGAACCSAAGRVHTRGA